MVGAESTALQRMRIQFNNQRRRTRSFSAGQLAVLLGESTDVDDFIQSIRSNVSFGTLNPILEYCLRLNLKKRAAEQTGA